MELLQGSQRAMAWVCPDCGHGSPEPRDERAHLDAHRQLRQFLDGWDAAAAADRNAERRKRLRPVLLGIAALVAALVVSVAVLLRLTGGEPVAPPAAPRPVPEVPVPQADVPPPAPAPAPVPADGSGVPPTRSERSGNGTGSRTRPVTGPADTADSGIAPPLAPAPAPAAPVAVATVPAAAAPAPAHLLAVDLCLLGICLSVRL